MRRKAESSTATDKPERPRDRHGFDALSPGTLKRPVRWVRLARRCAGLRNWRIAIHANLADAINGRAR